MPIIVFFFLDVCHLFYSSCIIELVMRTHQFSFSFLELSQVEGCLKCICNLVLSNIDYGNWTSLTFFPPRIELLYRIYFPVQVSSWEMHCNSVVLFIDLCLLFSLNWQHQLCKTPRPNPDIKTLFIDHSCVAPTNGARAPPLTNGPLVGSVPKTGAFPPMGAHSVSGLCSSVSAFIFFFFSFFNLITDYCVLSFFSLFNQLFLHLVVPLLGGWPMLTLHCRMLL